MLELHEASRGSDVHARQSGRSRERSLDRSEHALKCMAYQIPHLRLLVCYTRGEFEVYIIAESRRPSGWLVVSQASGHLRERESVPPEVSDTDLLWLCFVVLR